MNTRRHLKIFLASFLVALSGVALAATFTYFSPATGILVGSASSYVTTAATSTNVISLWSGTCNSGTFLRGDGSCQSAGGGTGATTSPTCTVSTNVDSCAATANGLFYINVGTSVTGGFSVQIDPTSTGTARVRVSIPVTSAFAASTDAAGTCNTDTTAQTSSAVLSANATNDDFHITFSAAVTSNMLYDCTFAYRVL